MSSEEADINVVSSPEPSPRGHTDDEEMRDSHYHNVHSGHLKSTSLPTSPSSIAASLLTTSASTLSPSSFHSLHSAHLLSSQYNHLTNGHITTESTRLSPPKTPPETNNNNISKTTMSSTNSGYTSFSISSILSRNDSPNSKKNHILAPLPTLPAHFTNGGQQDAAMLTR